MTAPVEPVTVEVPGPCGNPVYVKLVVPVTIIVEFDELIVSVPLVNVVKL